MISYFNKSLIIIQNTIIIKDNIVQKCLLPLINHKYSQELTCLSYKQQKIIQSNTIVLTKIIDAKKYNPAHNEVYKFYCKVSIYKHNVHKYLGCSNKSCHGCKLQNVQKIGLSKCNKCNDMVIPKEINVLTVCLKTST